jgi:hypothetical protein
VNQVTADAPDAAGTWPKDRKPPVINPEWVTVEDAYQTYRLLSIRLPDGCTLVDVNEVPTLWRLVQGSNVVSLRRFDRVTLIAFDESFLVDAVVAGATNVNVTLAGIRRIDLPARTAALPGDDLHSIAWVGNGYQVIRRKDQMRMGPPQPTISAAQRHMDNLYPRPAA